MNLHGAPVARIQVDPGGSFLDSCWNASDHINIVGGRLSNGPERPAEGITIDARGLAVLPAYVDTHVHGIGPWRFWGHRSPEEYRRHLVGAAATLPRDGVGSFCPTSVTEEDGGLELLRAVRTLKSEASTLAGDAKIIGSHAEGPFLNATYAGAQTAEAMHPINEETVTRFLEAAGGSLAIVTASPSLAGFGSLVDAVHAAGALVQMGHDLPTPTVFDQAVECGVDGVTHLFNAMGGLNHRRDDLAPMALLAPGLYLETIINFDFVAASWIRLAVSVGPGRVVVVSDCIGDGNDDSEFNGVKVVPGDGGVLYRASDGAVWSTTRGVGAAVPLLRSAGLSWESIARVTSRNAVTQLHLDQGVAPGDPADIVCLTQAGDLMATVVGGKLAWSSAANSRRILRDAK